MGEQQQKTINKWELTERDNEEKLIGNLRNIDYNRFEKYRKINTNIYSHVFSNCF